MSKWIILPIVIARVVVVDIEGYSIWARLVRLQRVHPVLDDMRACPFIHVWKSTSF